jgi:uncharacterized membrane protein YhaH (DUF805 family)
LATIIAIYASIVVIAFLCFGMSALFLRWENDANKPSMLIIACLIILLVLFILFYFAIIWILIAQGARRCHDRNNSGWFQIIPFYYAWMLFADGDPFNNKYGIDPKMRNEEKRKMSLWEMLAIILTIVNSIGYMALCLYNYYTII